MNNKNVLVLDKEAIIKKFGGEKKTQAEAYRNLARVLGYDAETLQSYKIFRKTLRPEVAMRLDEQNLSQYYLNIKTLLYLMCIKGTTKKGIGGTNEKIALATMLLDYPEKTTWTCEEITNSAKTYVDCTVDKISKALKNTSLFNDEGNLYSLNIHGICSKLQENNAL